MQKSNSLFECWFENVNLDDLELPLMGYCRSSDRLLVEIGWKIWRVRVEPLHLRQNKYDIKLFICIYSKWEVLDYDNNDFTYNEFWDYR